MMGTVLAVAILAAACGPSAADRAAERLESAWAATERLDPNLAQAELDAALEISERMTEPVRPALEARIAAVRLWNDGQTALVRSDYLAAIDAFSAAASTDSYFQTRAVSETRAAEQSYVALFTASIPALLEDGDAAAAYAELTAVHDAFPDNPALPALRGAVAEAYLPLLDEGLAEVVAGDRPQDARQRLRAVLEVVGSDGPEAIDLAERTEEAVAAAEEARRVAAAEEAQRRAEAARLAAEERQREVDAIFSRIGCVGDDLERTKRCYDRASYSRTPSNRLYFYTSEADGRDPTLQVRLQTLGSRWLFWEWARIYVGSQTFDIDPPWRDLVRDNSARSTWESYARRVNDQDLRMMRAIASEGEATVRFVNKEGIYREHKLTAAQIRAVRNMAAYWDLLEDGWR